MESNRKRCKELEGITIECEYPQSEDLLVTSSIYASTDTCPAAHRSEW